MTKSKKFLFVLTSHAQLGNSGKKTGFHYMELTDPYYILQDHGIEVDIASIKGGEPPADPDSFDAKNQDKNEPSVNRFRKDSQAMEKLNNSLKISTVKATGYEGIYLPGGHGTMWDFPENKDLQRVIEDIWKKDGIVAAVCHGPAGLLSARDEEGQLIIKNRRVNSFTDEEERSVKKDKLMPFALETKLRELGGLFESAPPFCGTVAEDGRLITGQNPPSAHMVAKSILQTLGISPYTKDEEAAA